MKKRNLIFIVLIFIFASCEDIIDIDLNSIEPRVVIEGSIIDDKQVTVKVTHTGDYYDPIEYPAISGAIVTVTDEDGNSEILNETDVAGVYKSQDMVGKQQTNYKLKVEYDGEVYESESFLPKKLDDWVSFFSIDTMDFGDTSFIFTRLICGFNDIQADTINYYRVKTYKLDDSLKGDGTFEIFKEVDLLEIEGRQVIPIRTDFQLQDTVIIELWSINKDTYDFLNTLAEIAQVPGGGPPPTSTPANPVSNITNGAFGTFSAYSLSVDTTKVSIIPFK